MRWGSLWESIGAAEGLGAISEQLIEDVEPLGPAPGRGPVTKGAALFPRLPEEVTASA